MAEHPDLDQNTRLAHVRHELRNPLNAILGYGQLLSLDDLAPDQRDAVDEILAAGNLLLELIETHLGDAPGEETP